MKGDSREGLIHIQFIHTLLVCVLYYSVYICSLASTPPSCVMEVWFLATKYGKEFLLKCLCM